MTKSNQTESLSVSAIEERRQVWCTYGNNSIKHSDETASAERIPILQRSFFLFSLYDFLK